MQTSIFQCGVSTAAQYTAIIILAKNSPPQTAAHIKRASLVRLMKTPCQNPSLLYSTLANVQQFNSVSSGCQGQCILKNKSNSDFMLCVIWFLRKQQQVGMVTQCKLKTGVLQFRKVSQMHANYTFHFQVEFLSLNLYNKAQRPLIKVNILNTLNAKLL